MESRASAAPIIESIQTKVRILVDTEYKAEVSPKRERKQSVFHMWYSPRDANREDIRDLMLTEKSGDRNEMEFIWNDGNVI